MLVPVSESLLASDIYRAFCGAFTILRAVQDESTQCKLVVKTVLLRLCWAWAVLCTDMLCCGRAGIANTRYRPKLNWLSGVRSMVY